MEYTRDSIRAAYAQGRRNFNDLDLSRLDLSNLLLRGVDLSNSLLRYTNLASTSLEGSNLTNTNLFGANLTESYLEATTLGGNINFNSTLLNSTEGINYATCSFDMHGECGRQLTAVKIGTTIKLFCGCFSGTPESLQEYINSGNRMLYESRMLAFNFVMTAINMGRL